MESPDSHSAMDMSGPQRRERKVVGLLFTCSGRRGLLLRIVRDTSLRVGPDESTVTEIAWSQRT